VEELAKPAAAALRVLLVADRVLVAVLARLLGRRCQVGEQLPLQPQGRGRHWRWRYHGHAPEHRPGARRAHRAHSAQCEREGVGGEGRRQAEWCRQHGRVDGAQATHNRHGIVQAVRQRRDRAVAILAIRRRGRRLPLLERRQVEGDRLHLRTQPIRARALTHTHPHARPPSHTPMCHIQ